MWEGHCYLHGPSHQGSNPRLSPWLRPSANVSRLEAPWCCLRGLWVWYSTRARRTCGKLKRQLVPALGVEASRAVLHIPQRTTQARRGVIGTCGFAKIDASHCKSALLSAPASSIHALLVSQAPHAIKAIGEASNCCNRPSQRAGEHHRRANQRTRCATGQQN